MWEVGIWYLPTIGIGRCNMYLDSILTLPFLARTYLTINDKGIRLLC
jgi:hypothetical protein